MGKNSNLAREGDVVVDMRCKCAGASWVQASKLAEFGDCRSCRSPYTQGERRTLGPGGAL